MSVSSVLHTVIYWGLICPHLRVSSWAKQTPSLYWDQHGKSLVLPTQNSDSMNIIV